MLVFSHRLLVCFLSFFHDNGKNVIACQEMGWVVGRTKNINTKWGSWVTHIKEEVRQIAAREANLPVIFHKTWQVENPQFLLCRTQQTSACHCSSPSTLPTNRNALFGTQPKSLRNLTVDLRAHLPISIAMGTRGFLWEQEEFDENFLGTWWEQKKFDWNMMGKNKIWWVIDGNKRNLMRIV
jgi:hypothetical protein